MRLDARWLVAAGAVFLLGACAPDNDVDEVDVGVATEESEARPPYADWDLDTDARLALDEFRQWWRERDFFPDWDDDDNDTLGDEEFAGGMLALWDDDDDDMLSEPEWNDNVGDWFDEDHSTFAAWDKDADGMLTRTELREGFIATDFFGDWDLNDDDVLDEHEFEDGFFGLFDDDDDGYLDEREWQRTDRWTL